MSPATSAHPAELETEVIPGIAAATMKTAAATGERVANVGAGLRSEQQRGARAEDEPQAEAGGEHA